MCNLLLTVETQLRDGPLLAALLRLFLRLINYPEFFRGSYVKALQQQV